MRKITRIDLFYANIVVSVVIFVVALLSVFVAMSSKDNFTRVERLTDKKHQAVSANSALISLHSAIKDVAYAENEIRSGAILLANAYNKAFLEHMQNLQKMDTNQKALINEIMEMYAEWQEMMGQIIIYAQEGQLEWAQEAYAEIATKKISAILLKAENLSRIITLNKEQEEKSVRIAMDRFLFAAVFLGLIGMAVAIVVGRRTRIQSEENEKALRDEKENTLVTLSSIGDGVIVTDMSRNIKLLNPVAEKLTGWKTEDAIGKPFATVFNLSHEDPKKTVLNPVEQVLKTGEIFLLSNHAILTAKEGTRRNVSDSAAPIRDENAEMQGVVMVFRDVTEKRAYMEKIQYMSRYDSLTGLCNRAFFEEEMQRVEKHGKVPFAMIMGDVNGLKLTNDVFGHAQGDALLEETANIIKKCARKQDIIGRWGGDEFVVCMPGANEEDAKKLCDRIYAMAQAQKPYWCEGALGLSISLGFDVVYQQGQTARETLYEAENKMYHAKLLESKSVHSNMIAFVEQTLYEKNYEMREHAERMVQFCMELGRKHGFSPSKMEELRLLAKLHDIGKISIDINVLQKKEPLTEKEWEMIKRHPEIGYRIALSTPETASIADYILAHHERWDGYGYPQGLKDVQIPLVSRIVAIVDAFDAMTHDRPYRNAMTIQEAKKELLDNAGKQFDPHLVKLMLEVLETKDWHEFGTETSVKSV